MLGPRPRRRPPARRSSTCYVKQLVTEMTVKAGQKCTAIRRAFVPAAPGRRGRRGGRGAAGQGRPSATRPTRPCGWARWPASTSAKRSAARSRRCEDAAHGRLRRPGARRGGRRRRRARRVHVPDPAAGRRRPPAELHEVEAFGPVSTLIGYRDAARRHRARRARQGQPRRLGRHRRPGLRPRGRARRRAAGTAACSCSTDDAAAESTGHGSPLPMLVHGGPGRAGGGEEMGGMRGVLPPHAAHRHPGAARACSGRVTGRWVHGRAAHRRRRAPVPQVAGRAAHRRHIYAGPRTVTLEDIEHFAEFTGDTFYAHMDEEAAATNPFFGGRVAHGYLIVSLAAGLFVAARLRARCWPTTASTTCASSRRSSRATRSR